MELACSYVHQDASIHEPAGDHAGRIAGGIGPFGVCRLVGKAKSPTANCIIVGKFRTDLPIPTYPCSYKSLSPRFGKVVSGA